MPNIKMIVTDIDGTFLRNDLSYNKELFHRIMLQLKKQGIHFVVASGRGYDALYHIFDSCDNITFVTDSGAYIRNTDEILYMDKIPTDKVKKIVKELMKHNLVEYLLSGKECIYIDFKNNKDEFIKTMGKYYSKVLDTLLGYDNDSIFKITVRAEREEEIEILKKIGSCEDTKFDPIVSGDEFIDLVNTGVDKAVGLRYLQQKWNINDEVIVFGDSKNDLDMLTNYKNSIL